MNNTLTVIKVKSLSPIEGADKIQLVNIFGTQVIVGKDVNIGDILIYADSNMQMSHEFLSINNLFRNKELNLDKEKTGYFEDNGRVKCIKMKGVISDGFLFPPEYLEYATNKEFKVGDEFNELEGHQIGYKYIPKYTRTPGSGKGNKTSLKKRECPMFVEHFDTGQFFKEKDKIPPGTICYIEEKIHGTSHRVGNMLLKKEVSKLQKFFYKFFNYLPKEWTYLNGTRRVVHFPKKKNQYFHDNTMREEVLEKVRGQLFKGEELYLELFGYEKSGGCIQKDFPYGCKQGEYRAMLYRVTMNNEDGKVIDYNREAVYRRAEELGFESPTLFSKIYYDESNGRLLEEQVKHFAYGTSSKDPNTLKEGVVVWFINNKGFWECLKYKQDAFRLKESGDKDKGIIDQEDLQ